VGLRTLSLRGAGDPRAPQGLTEDPALHHLQGQVLAGHLGTQVSPRHRPQPSRSPARSPRRGGTHGVGAGGAEHGAGGAEQAEELVAAPLLGPLVPPGEEEMEGQEGTGDRLGHRGDITGRAWDGLGQDVTPLAAGSPVPPWCGAQIPPSAS